MSTINKKSRKPYRILTDVKNKIWDEIHFLTDAKSVDAADGTNLETKVGAIKGITSSPNVTEGGYAVDAAALNSRLGNQEFGFDSDGNFAHRAVGADTWLPFKSGGAAIKLGSDAGTYDIKSVYPDYVNLTDRNFAYTVSSITAKSEIGPAFNFPPSNSVGAAVGISYHADTGILTVSNAGGTNTRYDSASKTYNKVTASAKVTGVWLVVSE